MENNENEFEKDPYSNNEGGYTQAPNSYNINGQPMGNPYGQPPQGSQGFAIAGMVLGIISLVCCCMGTFTVVLGIAGFVFSVVSLVQKRPGKGMAIAGIVCSAIGIILSVFVIIINVSINSMNPADLQRILEEELKELERIQ